MADKNFNCVVLTPERAVLKTEAHFAAIPAFDGEIGVMHDRAPLLCRLGIGVVRLETGTGTKHLFVDAGFAEVVDNRLTILTEQALAPEEIDAETEQAAQAAARRRRAATPDEQHRRNRELARAAAKLKLAQGH